MSKGNIKNKLIDVDKGKLICVECVIIILICFYVLNRYALGIASLEYRSFFIIDLFFKTGFRSFFLFDMISLHRFVALRLDKTSVGALFLVECVMIGAWDCPHLSLR